MLPSGLVILARSPDEFTLTVLRWSYRVHEQILPALRQQATEVRWSEVVIHHSGYQDPTLRGRKLQRDLRLLRLEDAEKPNDPFTLFNLGSVHQELGQLAEAVIYFCRSLERSQPGDSIVRKLYALLAQCHRHLGQKDQALAACRDGRKFYPDDIELLFQEGLVHREAGNLAAAEKSWLQLLQNKEAPHFASVDTGLSGYKARHNLAVIYQEQGRLPEAEALCRAVLKEQPTFLPACLQLAELLLKASRWAELEETVQCLKALPNSGPLEAAVLRARAAMGRRDFALARQLLTEAIDRYPRELRPRILLSHSLLQEGKDWPAAEQALREVLARAPGHAETRHNLNVLLEKQSRGRKKPA